MQCIAFDLGNVVFHINLLPVVNKMREFGYNSEAAYHLLEEYEKPSFVGLTDFKRFFTYKLCSCSIPPMVGSCKHVEQAEELTEIWKTDCIWLNSQMSNFIANLRYEGIKVAALSNIGQIHGELLKNDKEFNELMDVLHFSYEVGTFKPHKLFFQSFLMQNDEFAGCLYLDDRIENVKAAAEHKFDSIQFDLDKIISEPPSVLKKELSRIKERISRGY